MPNNVLNDVKIVFSDKSDGDFSLPEEGIVFSDDNAGVLKQHGIDASCIVNMRQVHGSRVMIVGKEHYGQDAQDLIEADCLITQTPGVGLAVRTADCVPVVLSSKKHSVVSVIHGGWRSLSQGIIACAFDEIRHNFGAKPHNFSAIMGPSIQSCCYEVGQEMCGVFPKDVIPKNGNWFLDLNHIVEAQLLRCGVEQENIFKSDLCTHCNGKFFSYRRDKKTAGRMITAAVIVPNNK